MHFHRDTSQCRKRAPPFRTRRDRVRSSPLNQFNYQVQFKMTSPRPRVLISAVILLLIPVVLPMTIDPSQLDHNQLANQPPIPSRSDSQLFPGKSPIVDAPIYGGNQVVENTWTDTFRRALHGPTGQMVVHIAKEVIARQVGGTQVLSLNLTNLLILLFLKAIIFAAGLIGAGSWGQYARSLDNGEINECVTVMCFGAFFSLLTSSRVLLLNDATRRRPSSVSLASSARVPKKKRLIFGGWRNYDNGDKRN